MATEVEKQSSQESLEYDEKEAESEIMDALPFMETDLKKEETPAPSTITSPEISPSFPPLPDFMSVLNMQPAKKDDESGTTTVTTTITPGNNTQTQDSIVAVTTKVEEVEEKAGGVSLTPGTKEMLVDKFKQGRLKLFTSGAGKSNFFVRLHLLFIVTRFSDFREGGRSIFNIQYQLYCTLDNQAVECYGQNAEALVIIIYFLSEMPHQNSIFC